MTSFQDAPDEAMEDDKAMRLVLVNNYNQLKCINLLLLLLLVYHSALLFLFGVPGNFSST